MKIQTVIKVKQSEELVELIDKILTSEGENVFVDLEDNSSIVHTLLNLQLLKREVESVGKNLILITSNKRVQNLAAQVSIKTKQNLDSKSLKRRNLRAYTQSVHMRDVADIIAPHQIKKREGVVVVDLHKPMARHTNKLSERQSQPSTNLDDKLRVTTFTSEIEKKKKFKFESLIYIWRNAKEIIRGIKTKKRKVIWVTGVVAGIFAVLFLVVSVLPHATVLLNPETVQEIVSIPIRVDSSISSLNLINKNVPGQILEEKQENTFTFDATGSANIKEKAKGEIIVYNEYSSSPQTLVASTRFLSANSKLFNTVNTIVVPGATISGGKIIASSIKVDVIAAEPGDNFNIGTSTFSIPGFQGTDKYLAFYGKSEGPMSGGFEGTRTVVAQEDIDKANEKIKREFLPSVADSLRQKVPGSFKIVEDTFIVDPTIIEIDAKPQDAKDTFQIRTVALARAFVINEEDILKTIVDYFDNSTKYSSEFVLSDKRTISYNVKEIDFEKGYAALILEVQQMFNRKIDIEAVVQEIRGKSEVEVRRILAQKDGLERSQVRFWPFWVKEVPKDIDAIKVKVEYLGELQTGSTL